MSALDTPDPVLNVVPRYLMKAAVQAVIHARLAEEGMDVPLRVVARLGEDVMDVLLGPAP